MGLSSNLRKSSIQRCKAAASNNKTKNPQKTIEGGEAEPQCDDGTKLVNIRKRKERRPTLLMMSLVLLTVTIRSPMEAAFLWWRIILGSTKKNGRNNWNVNSLEENFIQVELHRRTLTSSSPHKFHWKERQQVWTRRWTNRYRTCTLSMIATSWSTRFPITYRNHLLTWKRTRAKAFLWQFLQESNRYLI